MPVVRAISDAVGVERLGPRGTPRARIAIERFRIASGAVVLLVVTGASVGARGVSAGSSALLGACAICLVAAVVVGRTSRRRLVAELRAEAEGCGYGADAARDRALATLERLLYGPSARAACRRSMESPEITITEADLERLGALLVSLGPAGGDAVDRLDEELARAHVVAPRAVEPDVVTMNSRVRYLEEREGVTREITLVYPAAADIGAARVSVLAPVGSALLGLRVGQSIDWPMRDGRRKRYRVLAVPYQPEAAGHFHL